VAALSLLAAPVSASVPKGTYECFNLGYNFTLKGHDKYRVQTGGGGKWASKGHKVKFKTGPMNFAYGKERIDPNGGEPVIDLYDVADDTYYDNCPRT
jgi:hypothetical protein